MRSTVMYILFLSAVMVDGFAMPNNAELQQKPRPNAVRRTDSKTKHLIQHQQIARNPDLAPGAKHHTHKLEMPGKHRDGAWLLGIQHKPKTKETGIKSNKAATAPGGRKWSFDRVPWW
jgi:hypothetical protein